MIRNASLASATVLAIAALAGCAAPSTATDEAQVESAGTAAPMAAVSEIAARLELGSRTEQGRVLQAREKDNACVTSYDGRIMGRFDGGTIYEVHEATTGLVGTAGIRSDRPRYCVSMAPTPGGRPLVLDGGALTAVLALDLGRLEGTDSGAGHVRLAFARGAIELTPRHAEDECGAVAGDNLQEKLACERNFLADQAATILTPSEETMRLEGSEGVVSEVKLAQTHPNAGGARYAVLTALLAHRHSLGVMTAVEDESASAVTIAFDAVGGDTVTEVHVDKRKSSYVVCRPSSLGCFEQGSILGVDL